MGKPIILGAEILKKKERKKLFFFGLQEPARDKTTFAGRLRLSRNPFLCAGNQLPELVDRVLPRLRLDPVVDDVVLD